MYTTASRRRPCGFVYAQHGSFTAWKGWVDWERRKERRKELSKVVKKRKRPYKAPKRTFKPGSYLRDVEMDGEFVYDGELCFELYLNYLKGIVPDDKLVTYLKRYIVMQVRDEYLHLGVEVCEDLVQASLTELWMCISKQTPPTDNVASFHAFINTVFRRQISRVFRTLYDDAPKELDPEFYRSRCALQEDTIKDVDDRIFLEDIPTILRRRVLEKFRLLESDRLAAEYVLDRVLSGERVVEPYLRRKYKVRDPAFLIEHVMVRARMVLYEYREFVDVRPDVEKRLVLDSVMEEEQ